MVIYRVTSVTRLVWGFVASTEQPSTAGACSGRAVWRRGRGRERTRERERTPGRVTGASGAPASMSRPTTGAAAATAGMYRLYMSPNIFCSKFLRK